MRGQLSFENLVLSLVAVVLIMISLAALVTIKDNAGKTFDSVSFKASAARIEAVANEVRALGHGNSRVVYLESPLFLESVPQGARATYESNSISFRSSCTVVDSNKLEGRTEIRNEKGKIVAE